MRSTLEELGTQNNNFYFLVDYISMLDQLGDPLSRRDFLKRAAAAGGDILFGKDDAPELKSSGEGTLLKVEATYSPKSTWGRLDAARYNQALVDGAVYYFENRTLGRGALTIAENIAQEQLTAVRERRLVELQSSFIRDLCSILGVKPSRIGEVLSVKGEYTISPSSYSDDEKTKLLAELVNQNKFFKNYFDFTIKALTAVLEGSYLGMLPQKTSEDVKKLSDDFAQNIYNIFGVTNISIPRRS